MLHDCFIYFGRCCFGSNWVRGVCFSMVSHGTLYRWEQVSRIEFDNASV